MKKISVIILSCLLFISCTGSNIDGTKVGNISLSGDKTMTTIHVTMHNTTDKLLSAGQIKAVLYDENGKVLATAPGTMLNIPAHDSSVVDCLVNNFPMATNDVKVQVLAAMFE